jgi:hypothetical protein
MSQTSSTGIAATRSTVRQLRGNCVTALAFVVVVVLIALPAQSQRADEIRPGTPPQAQGYKLVFEDDFHKFDLSPQGTGPHTWHEGVWFSQKHAPLSNISASGSILTLKWQRGQETSDTSISTLSRDTRHFKAWRYGYFEARMRWDVVRGAWPAFWLIPVQDATGQDIYNGTKESGEIDIFEGQGDRPHTFYGTVHDWVNLHDTPSRNNAFPLPSDVDMSQFHVYGLLWTPGKVTWYFDNRPLHSESTPAIVDKQDFFLVLGMQAGVDWKNGDLSGVIVPSMTLNVDWVRVWQK